MGLFNTAAVRPIISLLQQVPAFISRGATHHADARELYQRRRELLPMNFANKSLIHKSTRFFYMPQIWDMGQILLLPLLRHTEDFPDARKIQRLRTGLNPRNRLPVASMLTTRPPTPFIILPIFLNKNI